MGTYFKAIDRFAASLTRGVIAHRWLVILGAVIVAGVIGSGASKLEFSTNYRVFFSEANPELQAFEELQNTYTKNDNFFFVVEPQTGAAFDRNTMAAVEELTEAAWKIPYTIRVDSVSNFQHTYAVEDDLIVEDLVRDATSRDGSFLDARRDVALDEPLIRNQILTADAGVTAINVVLQYPEKGFMEVPEAVEAARALKADIEAKYPDLTIHLTGVSMLNNAFAETGMSDGATLMPLMFVVIFALTWLIIRSLTATFSTLLVIMLSTMVGMGAAGFAGIKLTPIAMSAPIVILTLAVADSIHILMSLRGLMREGGQDRGADRSRAHQLYAGHDHIPDDHRRFPVTELLGFAAVLAPRQYHRRWYRRRVDPVDNTVAGRVKPPALPREADRECGMVAAHDGSACRFRHPSLSRPLAGRRHSCARAGRVHPDAGLQRPMGGVLRRSD
jgi:predicted RND superfamily exporter protein